MLNLGREIVQFWPPALFTPVVLPPPPIFHYVSIPQLLLLLHPATVSNS